MLLYNQKEVTDINLFNQNEDYIQIKSIYSNRRRVWHYKDVGPREGYLFSKDGYALLSKEGYILKARNQ